MTDKPSCFDRLCELEDKLSGTLLEFEIPMRLDDFAETTTDGAALCVEWSDGRRDRFDGFLDELLSFARYVATVDSNADIEMNYCPQVITFSVPPMPYTDAELAQAVSNREEEK